MNERTGRLSVEHASALAAGLRATVAVLKRRLRAQGGEGDLTPSQVAVILRLEKDGAASVSSLARAEGMRHQSMTHIVNGLMNAGLVDGTADPNDARKTLMSLSRQCIKSLRQGRSAKQDWLTSTIQQKFSAGDGAKVEAVLEVLARLAED